VEKFTSITAPECPFNTAKFLHSPYVFHSTEKAEKKILENLELGRYTIKSLTDFSIKSCRNQQGAIRAEFWSINLPLVAQKKHDGRQEIWCSLNASLPNFVF